LKHYVTLAIPGFFLLIGLELLLLRWQRKSAYRLKDALTDVSIGIGQQLVGVFLRLFRIAGYIFVYEELSLYRFESDSALTWVIAFFGVDLLFYVWHRLSHRVNLLWAAHVVHHQSQDFNLAVALRQSWFSNASLAIFNLPLALIGIPMEVFVAVSSVNLVYQFLLHTETVRSLGPLEAVLNTPSHHRVHHRVSPECLDRNYGGILIVWDRLFGSFHGETEKDGDGYGTLPPFKSWNPVWANFEYWAELLRETRAASRVRDKLRLWFMPPGWRPDGLQPTDPPDVPSTGQAKFDKRYPPGLGAYIFVQYIFLVAAAFVFLLFYDGLETDARVAIVAVCLATIFSFGALFEARSWAIAVELVRLAALAVIAVVALGAVYEMHLAAAGAVAVLFASAMWLLRLLPALRIQTE
jgi:sterol desaturase/sphingolipid hydroxylase (fatty acid hydroxylase superfamily)